MATSFTTVHDVYLSFRSIDTRKTFVDPLCTALNLDGITTFFYDNELEGREEMSSLVSVSKIIIVVLSTNYASSTWCLDELVEILKSKKRTAKQKVFPIFYQVDPVDVRQQTGEFGTAFRKHTEMKNLREVETWKDALTAIGCLSGNHVPIMPTRTELQLDFPEGESTVLDIKVLHGLKEKVIPNSKVLAARNIKVMHVRNSKLTDIPDNISFPDLEKLFMRSNLDLIYIPMSFFERMPALKVLDMSNTSIKTLPPWVSKLIKLEELLLRCCKLLMELPHEISSLENLKVLDLFGCTALAECVNFPHSLSFLDLTNCKSLTKLPESMSMLGSLEYLNLSGCTNLAEIPESIDFPQSLSFLDLRDCKNLTKLPESITKLRFFNYLYLSGCTNLAEISDSISFPQSLSSLELKDCKSLTKLPESTSRLRSLEYLNLAGCTNLAEIPEYIQFLERLSALNLMNCRSLTKLPEKLRYLQYLNLAGCSGLFDVPNIFFLQIPTLKVLDMSSTSIKFLPPSVFKLIELEELLLRRCQLLMELPHEIGALGHLKVLDLFGCIKLAEIPDSIGFLQRLSSLDLTYCRSLTKLPGGINKLRSLQFLNLSGCTNLDEVESIGFPRSLSFLDLTNCKKLTKLPGSISKLKCLNFLSLSGCTNLVENLESINFPQSLSFLDLRDFTSLKTLPESTSKLRSLKYLYLSGCTNLVEILESVGFPRSLSLLDLRDCKRLTKLPESPCKLRSLQKLSLCGCSSLSEVPTSFFERMSALEVLDMSSTSVKTLPPSVSQLLKLEELLLRHCELLMELPHEISALKNLKKLDLTGCTTLAEIPEYIHFPQSLCSLDLRDCKSLTKLPECKSNLISLQKLDLSGCSILFDVPTLFFAQMPTLKILDMSSTSIKTLPRSISKLIKLEELILRHCELLMELPHEISTLGNLKVLDLEGTDLVCLPEELGDLNELRCLKVSLYDAVSYRKSKNIVDIIPRKKLSKLTQLEELSISVDPQDIWCNAAVEAIMEDLPSLRKLKTLKLYLPTTVLLQNLLDLKWNNDDLSIYQNLLNYSFIIGPQAQHLISRLPCDLEEEFLKLNKCLKYSNGKDNTTTFSEALKHANALYLDRHWTIQKFSVFKELNGLKFCLLVDCNEMQTVFDESDFNHGVDKKGDNFHLLQYLAIHYLKNLEVIWRGPAVGFYLQSLKVLVLHMCPNLNTIFTQVLLGDLVNLEEILVEDCAKIKTLIDADLSLPGLKKLSLLYLPELVSISSGLNIGPKLENIVIYDCPNLKRLPCVGVCTKEVVEVKGESEWWNALERSSDQPYAFSELDIDGDLLVYGNSIHLSVNECNAD